MDQTGMTPEQNEGGEAINVRTTASVASDQPVESAAPQPTTEQAVGALQPAGTVPAAPASVDANPTAPITDTEAPEQPAVEAPQVAPPDAQPSKHGAPIGAIIAAILVALGLAAVTVYAYIQTQEDTAKTNPTDTVVVEEQAPDVTPEDVDQTVSEVDAAVKSSDEATDLPESELTTQTLGL